MGGVDEELVVGWVKTEQKYWCGWATPVAMIACLLAWLSVSFLFLLVAARGLDLDWMNE